MKHRLFPIVAALIAVLLIGGLGCSKNNNSQVQVISAAYGVGTNFADVSIRVGNLLDNMNTGFEVHPNYLQADPLNGYNKFLVVVYEAKGRRHIFTASEGDTVSAQTLIEAAK